jgi:ubiquinone/menaquinone biosynthesis C-methylase UbiE
MHWTLGILRHFQAVSYALSFFQSDSFAMTTEAYSPKLISRIFAILAIGVLIIGFVYPILGAWNGIILSTWLIGTQKPWRGFLFVAAIAFIPAVFSHLGKLPINGIEYFGWMFAGALISVLPYLFHRIINPRLRGISATLALPLWGTAFYALGQLILPASIFGVYSLVETQKTNAVLLQLSTIIGTSGIVFLMYWLAAIVNWAWDYDFKREKVAAGAIVFCAVFLSSMGYGAFLQISRNPIPDNLPANATFVYLCLGAGTILFIWALFRADKRRIFWANKPETVAILQSPYTGQPLRVITENRQEFLVSESGEKFSIRNGIPIFLKPDDLTGSNQKYNQLYETIGGFYDSSQKFAGALLYGGSDHILYSYLRLLEIKPGDNVLETSVGTGLNYHLLPRDIQRFGLDLSAEMLANFQTNLRRWDMDAELFQGNAESLPFADNSMDVVYHAGGINFFNDRAKAIREMIRVAKPGSLILIADETEEHAKDAYEKTPVASTYFKNRKEAISAPIDLVPPDMLDIQLQMVWENRFYALTFRKPIS